VRFVPAAISDLFLHAHPVPLVLPPFPPRRSSDLDALLEYLEDHGLRRVSKRLVQSGAIDVVSTAVPGIKDILIQPLRHPPQPMRSEEHTAELQSPYELACPLLLEKKKP